MPLYRPPGWRTEAQRRTAYDRDRMRNGGDVYNNTRWRKLRAAYLATHPICECGCGWPATVVDHRTPHHGDDALMWSWDNLQAMTKACHDRKTATVDGGFGNRRRLDPSTPATSGRASARAGCIEDPHTVSGT
jgi:5-methylcytosine-specific restriction protein A